MAHTDAVDQGRAAFARRQWRAAYAQLSTADRDVSLEPADLERLATAAYLVGHDDRAVALWARVHHDWIEGGFTRACDRSGAGGRLRQLAP